MSLIRASTGAIVNLGQLLGRGGEGTVHAVNGVPKLAAKVYLKVPDADKAEKLRLMIRGRSSGLLDVAAWPVDLLTDERGAVRGFLMGRISARQDAHRLYTPKSRRGTFPDADFRFVVRAATNLARAFAQIHAAGHVIGDVNHGNALIGKDGTVVLIDCDSIQVRERARNRFFTCDVGTPLFTPPELQGKAFRGLRRTEASDRFGMAVLVFHLLFQGRHPFAGIYAGGEMPIEQAIAESRFVYGAHAATLGMSPPPGTLPLETFGRPIARLFERAFSPPGVEEERPSSIEWIDALQALERELTVCPRRPRHFHPRGANCCWCNIEMRTGASLFDDGRGTGAELDAVTAEELWKAIEGVRPPVEPELPTFSWEQGVATSGVTKWSRRIQRYLKAVPALIVAGALMVAIMGARAAIMFSLFGVSLLIGNEVAESGFRFRPSRLRRALQIEWEGAIAQWRNHTSSSLFTNARSQLANSRHSIGALVQKQREELEALERLLERSQHKNFLDSFEIEKAMFLRVTSEHVELLANRGIRTAGDVHRNRAQLNKILPGTVETELRDWEIQCALTFKFDKSDPVYVADATKIEEKYRQQRHALIEELRRGPQLLAAKRDEVADARARAEDALRRQHEYIRKRRDLEQ